MARPPPVARPFHAKSSKDRVCGSARLATVVRYLFTSAVLLSFESAKMSLNSKRSSLADVRPKIFTEMEADLEAQFLELLELRERVRQAELRRICKAKRGLESPRQLLSPQSPSMCG